MLFDVFQRHVSRYYSCLYNIYSDIDMVRPQKPENQSVPNSKSDVSDNHVNRLHYYVFRSKYDKKNNVQIHCYLICR